MEFRGLRDFIAVAEELSFTRAAARLYTTQPALSRRIQQLEVELGARLFDRTRSPIALTDAGEMLLQDARKMLDQRAASVRAIRELQASPARALRVGYARHLHYRRLPQVLSEFAKRWPAIDVTVRTTAPAELLASLEQAALDVVFVPKSDGVRGECVAVYRNLVAVPVDSPLAEKETVTPADFHGTPIVVLADEGFPGARGRLLRLWEGTGGLPRLVEAVDQFEDSLNFVAAGLGSALVPPQASLLYDSSRVVIKAFDVPLPFSLWMVWDEVAAPDYVRGFVAAVRAAARDDPEGPSRDLVERRRSSGSMPSAAP